jgi:hypothetical protein
MQKHAPCIGVTFLAYRWRMLFSCFKTTATAPQRHRGGKAKEPAQSMAQAGQGKAKRVTR